MKKITDRKKLILFGCSGLGVNMLTLMMGSYLCSALLVGGFEEHIESWTYLSKDLVVAGLWAVLVFLAKALDGIIDLPLSNFADKLHTKLGRRKTAILIGFVPMVISYLLFLFPLNSGATLSNTLWFGTLLCIFYTCYTLTMLTYYAAFAEICDSEKDTVFLSNVKSICDVVYFSLAYSLIPVFISLNINIRMVALIFLPLCLTMLIPFFLLKENGEEEQEVRALTLGTALKTAFQNKPYIYFLCTTFMMAIGLQLFLGGINEVFSSTGLNMTVVMASSFAPVPFTLILYNHFIKKKGLGFAYRYALAIYSVGMMVLYLCFKLSDKIPMLYLTLIALCGGILISFAIGAFFSINYTVPTHLAKKEFEATGKNVATMLFAVQGVFEGVAAGVATGIILVNLKAYKVISWLPILVAAACMIAFLMSLKFPDVIGKMGKQEKDKENQ
ncbi:MAG: MFS transporter [Clostridia bacterium]|nr:MFS transporter [Clostridia bacterium]